MSRAVRRRQSSATKESAVKNAIGVRRPQTARGARPPAQARRRFRLKAPSWLEEIISELKKVSWPTRTEVINTTIITIVVVFFFAAFLWVSDMGLSYLIQGIEWLARKIFG